MILREAHDAAASGHLAFCKTLERVREGFVWPGLAVSVKRYTSSCDVCHAVKPSNRTPAGMLNPLRVPEGKWTSMAMDLITQLPRSTRGNDAIVVFVDRMTKMARFVPTTTEVSAPQLPISS